MFKNQRQNEILEMLGKEKFISVNTLASRLYASLPTVRRDLTALENAGLVKRSHGGVMLFDGKESTPVSFRQGKHTGEKGKMARLAVRLINDGDLIFLDSSSTVLHLADYLGNLKELTAVTNGLIAAKRFSDAGTKVFSTGGRLLAESSALVGHSAERTVEEFNADIMFFSAAALSLDGIISDWSEDERNMRLSMARSSKVKVFLCDSSKFDKKCSFRFGGLSEVDYIVTDKPLSEDLMGNLSLASDSEGSAYLYKIIKE